MPLDTKGIIFWETKHDQDSVDKPFRPCDPGGDK